MQTTYKVGDKVRIISTDAALCGFSIGDKVEITKSKHDGSKTSGRHTFEVDGQGFCDAEHIELVSPKPTKNQRITTLEQKVEAMQAEIDALKAAQSVGKTAEAIAKAIEKHSPKLTPNEQRKAIIDEAKAFVEKYSGIVEDSTTPYTTESGDTIVKLYVNVEKRIVTAIPHLVHVEMDLPQDKKFAKCAPDDVFNADIGKAIALGRALGLDVSKFEKAVQPSEVVVGQVVDALEGNVKVFAVKPTHRTYGEGSGFKFSLVDEGFTFITEDDNEYWTLLEDITKITDDSEAQY